jgi:5-(carboxyamino)imidazole ribonucleotide synthase
MPLGNAEMHVKAVGLMNLLSNRWSKEGDSPNWPELLLRYPRLSVHLYGKKELRPNRKMGHLTLTKKDTSMVESAFDEINSLLTTYD